MTTDLINGSFWRSKIKEKDMATTKKMTTVQTSIDERETFVSLRKSFADNEQDAQQKLKFLYELQRADIEIDKLMQLRGELPDEVAALEQEVAALKARYEREEQVVEGFRTKIEENKKHIVEFEAEIDEYEKQLANISNSREYDSIEKEIENQKLLKAIAEKDIRESYDAIDNCGRELEKISNRMTIREGDLEAKREELSTIVESTADEEKTLQARREDAQRIQQDTREHPQPPGCRHAFPQERGRHLRRCLRRLLPYCHPSAYNRHNIRQEARDLRALWQDNR